MTVKRPFNRSDYERYDQVARDILEKYLVKKGHVIVNKEENFNVDVVSQKHGLTFFNEVEVKAAWKGDWPTHWSEIRIPERKKRLLQMYQDETGVLNFYILRSDLKQAWRIKDTLLGEENLKEAYGRHIAKGERFFHIPYTKAELVEI